MVWPKPTREARADYLEVALIYTSRSRKRWKARSFQVVMIGVATKLSVYYTCLLVFKIIILSQIPYIHVCSSTSTIVLLIDISRYIF